ncbi:MAG: hypothetical protein HC771_08085 [Synechococcales cyanobacterium CRU_2_2]|nr:hypothetical protein [Synechococcales cyanobacterium CRU_2_2]
METIRAVNGDPGAVWDELSWVEMNSSEQGQWAVLGWDADSWEEETDPPNSDDQAWEDLTPAERTAAEKLGYTELLWNEE